MKTKSFLFFLFITTGLFAQIKDHAPAVKKRNAADWIVFGIHNDMWLNIPKGIKTEAFSPGIDLSYLFDVPFGKGNVGFAWGLGWSSVNVHSNGQINYLVDSMTSKISTYFKPRTDVFKKNKLVCNYIGIPLELRFRDPGNKFHFCVGVKAGYLLNSHTKEVDDVGKRKVYRIENLNRFHYGLTMGIGSKRWSITAFYSLIPLIEKNKGDDKIIPFSIGIATRPF